MGVGITRIGTMGIAVIKIGIMRIDTRIGTMEIDIPKIDITRINFRRINRVQPCFITFKVDQNL